MLSSNRVIFQFIKNKCIISDKTEKNRNIFVKLYKIAYTFRYIFKTANQLWLSFK